MNLLDEILERVNALPPAEQEELKRLTLEATKDKRFVPNPGPQTEAYESLADETFYGGGAGAGKSALLCGTAIQEHSRSIIFRREYPQIKGLIDETARILGTRDGYNAQDKLWRLPNGNELEFGSVQHEFDKEKYQGRAHDLKGFDEITHFSESQYRFLIAWNRSSDPSQRCRVIVTGNPPMGTEGAWVIQYWGAWLDPTHSSPAKPGEVRWYAVMDGVDVEVDGPGPHKFTGKDGVERDYLARSRTFILGKLEDNPDLLKSGYASVLEAMPEPLRTMMREGRFDVGQKDQAFQVIPTAWIVAAQNRWKPDGWKDFAMTAMAFDPAGGGRDSAELCWRHGGWFAEIVSTQGEETADGSAAAAELIKHRRDNAPVIVDVGGGYGGAVTLRLKDNGIPHVSFNGAAKSHGATRDGKIRFVNKRAEAYWRVREALDPDQQGGSFVALPPDPKLRAELAAPTFEMKANGLQIESKDDLRDRLGRSPGRADAVVMCLSEGNSAVRRSLGGTSQSQPVTVNLGYSETKAKLRGRG